eukprot:m.7362 g.7362  ORF g.7362 m.7362 type:complete len:437 (+) comp5239_c0_seq2:541-1851(+)
MAGKAAYIGGGVLVVLVIIVAVVLGSSKSVSFESNAVVISRRGEVNNVAVGPGRQFIGLGADIVEFPRFDQNLEFTANSAEGAILVRVQDGQIISIDVSFQYNMAKEQLPNLYRVHRTSFEDTLSKIMRDELRDAASKRPSQDFFDKRAEIAADLRATIEREAEARDVTVTGFQIRRIGLPESLESRLIDIQIRQLDVTLGEQNLILDSIYARWNKSVLEFRTNRERLATEIQQGTTVLKTKIIQERNRVEETTNQLVTKIQEESDRNVTLYQKETDLLIQDLELNITRVLESTRRDVDRVTVEAETNLTIYEQETANLGLAYDERVVLIEERSMQNVSRLLVDLQEQEQKFYAEFERRLASAIRDAELRTLNATLTASLNAESAKVQALQGRDAITYITEVVAGATVTDVKYMDVMTPKELALQVESDTNSTTTP